MDEIYDAYSVMNRIRSLRERAGLTQDQLAAKMKTSQANIARWESGERFPRGKNLVMLAEALGVNAADLIDAVLAIDLKNEIEPVEVVLSAAMAKSGIKAYRVLSDSVSRTGIDEGDLVLLNSSPEALSSLAPGDIVTVEAETMDGSRVKVLRQFLPPDLVTTNRDGTNLSVRMSDGPHALRLVAKVVPN